MQRGSMRWSAVDSDQLRVWHGQEDEAVVYHCPSGDTYLLNALQSELLILLESGPHTSAELLTDLAQSIVEEDEEDRARSLEYIDHTLLNLRDLGLVKSATV